MATNTTNFGFTLPSVNSPTDENLWGGQLNGNWTALDSLLLTASNITTRATTGTDSITSADQNKIILANAAAGAFAETLPAASSVTNGFMVIVKKTDSTGNAVTITPAGADTIDGLSSFAISAQYGFVALVSDHVSNWNIVGQSTVAVTGVVKTVHRQVLTSSSGTYTPTTGMLYADIEMVGGGGGGSGSIASGGNNSVGSGGGAGGYLKKIVTAAAIGASQAYTIGAAGAAGNNSGGTGGNGGSTGISGLSLSAGGGIGGGIGSPTTGSSIGGLGGTSSGGDLNIAGQAGGSGYAVGASAPSASGAGASSQFGAGGLSVMRTTGTAGNNGLGNGSGGSGAAGTGTAFTGGAGTAGIIVITEYCSQ